MPPIASSLSAPLSTSAAAAINHLLAQESWARDALLRHAGKLACIDASGITLNLRAARDGMLEAAQAGSDAQVTIRVRLADLPLILQNRERAFSYVTIEGDAEFANTISQLSKGLRWEAEVDLERVLGPIAARRLAAGVRDGAAALRGAHRKAAENLAEFLTEEQPLLVRPPQLEQYGSEVGRLRDDVERTAKRIARLEQLLGLSAQMAGAAGQQPVDL